MTSHASTKEPDPIRNEHPPLWPAVIAEIEPWRERRHRGHPDHGWPILFKLMQERHEFGVAKYSVGLQPFNGRNPLVDALQESLDLVVYLKSARVEAQANGKSRLVLNELFYQAVDMAFTLALLLDAESTAQLASETPE